MSCVGPVVATCAGDVVPSANVTWMAVASATTCRLVRMSPAASTMTPLPRPEPTVPDGPGVCVRTRTSEGRMAA